MWGIRWWTRPSTKGLTVEGGRGEEVIQQMTHSLIHFNHSKCYTKGMIKPCIIFVIWRKWMTFLKSTLFFFFKSLNYSAPPFPRDWRSTSLSFPKTPSGTIIPSPSKGWNPAPQAIISYSHKIRVLKPWQLARVTACCLHVSYILTPSRKWKEQAESMNKDPSPQNMPACSEVLI